MPFDLRGTEAQTANNLLTGGGLLSTFFWDWSQIGTNGRALSSNGGSSTPVAGAYQVTSSASASRINFFDIGIDAGANGSTGFRTGQPWYTAGRFAVTTAITAQTVASVGLGTGGGVAAGMGVNGTVSTSFFTLAGSAGSPIVTSIPIDTAMHTHRAWRVGGVTSYQIDGGQIFTGTADIAAGATGFFLLQNGTDTAARTIQLVWQSGACPFL